jgi:hypothetical protein
VDQVRVVQEIHLLQLRVKDTMELPLAVLVVAEVVEPQQLVVEVLLLKTEDQVVQEQQQVSQEVQ